MAAAARPPAARASTTSAPATSTRARRARRCAASRARCCSTGSCTGSRCPDMGFRALRLRERFDLVHVHAHPVRLSDLGSTPLVMSEGSSARSTSATTSAGTTTRLARGLARSRRAVPRARDRRPAARARARDARVRLLALGARAQPALGRRSGASSRVLAPGFPDPGPVQRDDARALHLPVRRRRLRAQGRLRGGRGVRRAAPRACRTCGSCSPARTRAGATPTASCTRGCRRARRARALELLAELERDGIVRAHRVGRSAARCATRTARADAFVMPTHAEGFGFTNVEAMSFGLPVITSTAGPAAEIVDDGRRPACSCGPATWTRCATRWRGSSATRPSRADGRRGARARSSRASRSSASAEGCGDIYDDALERLKCAAC